ncbi:hypothetical protein MNBD_BACTEROID01-2926 [hydrothermal vent metagenome]|uniref:Uncharacterized protein n=1 Tax=hydrothermal vent metagenome TaxID=652676 RepID=A0A3B0U1L1_9ZZZZ
MAKKHVFDSEETVEGMGWKTLALCVGFLTFFIFDCSKLFLFHFFSLHITNSCINITYISSLENYIYSLKLIVNK